MPKTKKKKTAKAVRIVKKSRVAKTGATDNKLVISALVLLLAVAIFMLVEAWIGIK